MINIDNKTYKFILEHREIEVELSEIDYCKIISDINDGKFIYLTVNNKGYHINPRHIVLIKEL